MSLALSSTRSSRTHVTFIERQPVATVRSVWVLVT
jgi:hypothetical protein